MTPKTVKQIIGIPEKYTDQQRYTVQQLQERHNAVRGKEIPWVTVHSRFTQLLRNVPYLAGETTFFAFCFLPCTSNHIRIDEYTSRKECGPRFSL